MPKIERKPCDWCGKDARVALIFRQERGEFVSLHVCVECKRKHDRELAASRDSILENRKK